MMVFVFHVRENECYYRDKYAKAYTIIVVLALQPRTSILKKPNLNYFQIASVCQL